MLTKHLSLRQASNPYRRRLGAATLLMVLALLVGVGELSGLRTSAQRPHPFCVSDELLSQSLRQDPALLRKMDEQQTAIRDYVESKRSKRIQQQSATSNLIIPVVVYVVHNSGTPLSTALNITENISDQQVNSQITALNNAFSGQGVQFCLATKQGSTVFTGSTPGIIRIPSGFTNHLTSQENQLKTLLPSLPGDRYLRIWVVKDIDNNSGVAGYARFPGTVPLALEGIVMRYDVFGNKMDPNCNCPNLLANYDQGEILAHEVGHYLYLYHPFQGGCTGSGTSDCNTAGDFVCDTPQVAAPNTGCPVSATSCTAASALITNHMDYTDDTCRASFSPDQGSRMAATINTLRSLLVSAQNLVYTGVQCAGGLNAAFSADNYNPCANQSVTFSALTGTNYAWDFGDGGTGSSNPVTHSYTTAGTYNVTLTVTSGSNSVSSTQQIFVTPCAPINSSQGNWYFGNVAGLNFSSGSPVPALGAFTNQTIHTLEGVVSQSDPSGNHLFYSDGISLWDRNHLLVNPTTPLTGHNSSSQSALSVPVPGNTNRYYLFTIPSHQFDPSANFAYSIVDVTGGNASLVSANTPVTLPTGATSVSEAATAVQKCNGDYWVIVRGYFNDSPPLRNSFYVYSVTASGVTLAGTYPFANRSFVGQLKMSPDGTSLACSGGAAVLCDFNRGSGVLSNPRNFSKGDYGIAFSPDSRVFYIAETILSPVKQTLYQYDLLNPNPASTERIVATTPDIESSLQLGPDQKVYMSLHNQKHLAVVNFPNNLVSTANPNACGFSYNGPSLVTSTSQAISSQLGLPNMIDALPPAQVLPDFFYIISSCSTVKFSAPACAASYGWNFGDATTSNAQTPTHTYAANGTYTVTLTLNGATTVTHTITIGIPASSANIFGPSQVCLGSGNPPFYNYSANAQPGLTYNWTVTGGAISGVSNSNNVDVVWNNLPGTVQLTVADSLTGCSMTRTLTVNQSSFSGTDLYMKDTMAPDLPEDFGVEPTVSQLLYISRDIWVRTSQDTTTGTSANPGPDSMLLSDSYYTNEHQHQDPTYSATIPSYVYVKVRNRGCASSTGTEKLRVYWANASTGLPWPDTNIWNEIDCVAGIGTQPCSLPVIAAGQDYVVELPWMTPDPATFGGDHFCLVARIETVPSAPFGMTSAEGPLLWQNVAANNNIAWKNVTVFTGTGRGHVIVRNTFDRATPLTLHFAVPATELRDNLLLHGDIFVDLGDALMKKWRQGGQRPQGFEVVGKTTIKITDPTNAVLGGLLFAPGEKQTIEVRMQLRPGDKARVGRQFNWDVIQMAPPGENAKPSPIGGERYVFVVPNLTMTKTVAPNPALTGQTLTYTVKYTNNGTADAFDVELKDTLPHGLTLGAITASCPVTASSSNTVTVTCAQVPKAPNPGSTVIVTYQALANPATCPVTLENQANLTWTSVSGPQPILNRFATTAWASVKIDCPCTATISGLKFNDLNGNGVRNTSEPGLANWTIKVTDSSGNIQTATTDSQGNYSITVPTPGTYTVSEVKQDGWFPTTGGRTITVAANESAEVNFGNIDVRRREFTLARGMNEFCIWGGGGPFNSPRPIDNPISPGPTDNPNSGVLTGNNSLFRTGNTGGVRSGTIGLCYGRILSANDTVAFQYTFNAIPVAVLSYPEFNPVFIDRPFPVVSVSETRRNVFGAGLSPIGFQLYFRPQSRIKPFVNTSGGFIFFKDPVPRLNGAQFNFTYDFGGGVQVFRDSRHAFNFGYRYQHLSSGGRALNDPGFNGHVFYFGYSIFKAQNRAER